MNAWRVVDSGFLVDISPIHVEKIGVVLYFSTELEEFFTTDEFLCDEETSFLYFTRISARRAAVETLNRRVTLLKENIERLESMGKDDAFTVHG